MATTAMKGLVGAAQANVRAEEESMDPVKLIASDGTEVILDRRAAMVSGTIKAMLSGQFAESRGECRFPEITSSILEVCDQLIAVPRSSLPCPPACHACR